MYGALESVAVLWHLRSYRDIIIIIIIIIIDGLYLGTDVISLNQSLKYLGLLFKSGKSLNVDIEGAIM